MNAKRLYQLHYLSADFYRAYPSAEYPEIEQKPTRPYMVLLVKIEENTFALPLRTHIRHQCCYKFRNSSRPTDSVTGIDFTKAVVIRDASFIGDAAEIDHKEYVELNEKIDFIIGKFKVYLKGYYKFVAGDIHECQALKYRYTTLKYFHRELNIADPSCSDCGAFRNA